MLLGVWKSLGLGFVVLGGFFGSCITVSNGEGMQPEVMLYQEETPVTCPLTVMASKS